MCGMEHPNNYFPALINFNDRLRSFLGRRLILHFADTDNVIHLLLLHHYLHGKCSNANDELQASVLI